MIINTSNISEARKQIEKLNKTGKKVIVKAGDDDFNRKILENPKVDVLLSVELTGKDKLKQRGGGLNEILCRLASKNKISIGIDLNEILKKDKKEKAIILSRLIQNIKLCKKTKTKICFFGNYDKRNISSLLLSLGASTKQIKEIELKEDK